MSTFPTSIGDKPKLPIAVRAPVAEPRPVVGEAERRTRDALCAAVSTGLSANPKTLPAWLFYDEKGSRLFERITVLPEYYLTRTERAIFTGYAVGIIQRARAGRPGQLRILELGAGTASKTGILLHAAVSAQGRTQYLPIDVSASAMEDACSSIERSLPDVVVEPQVANYVTETLSIPRHDGPTLALYIGSSIANFAPDEAIKVLRNLRAELQPGDSLLLGADLVKDVETMTAAYCDSSGVTEAFNLNMLRRINRELGGSFDLSAFKHVARWNETESRIEMHLQSTRRQIARVPSLSMNLSFAEGETIHTENSYKFTLESIDALLVDGGFSVIETWSDERNWFAVTLAAAA